MARSAETLVGPTSDAVSVAPIDIRPYRIRSLIRLRELRNRHFVPGLFGEPGWDIILDLALAYARGGTLSFAELRCAGTLPPASLRRWVGTLVSQGLVKQEGSQLLLSDKGWESVDAYLSDLRAVD